MNLLQLKNEELEDKVQELIKVLSEMNVKPEMLDAET